MIELHGRLSCSWDGSTSGNSSSGSVLSIPLAVVVDDEFIIDGCGEDFDEFFASFFCCFKNPSKQSISIEYNESVQ